MDVYIFNDYGKNMMIHKGTYTKPFVRTDCGITRNTWTHQRWYLDQLEPHAIDHFEDKKCERCFKKKNSTHNI